MAFSGSSVKVLGKRLFYSQNQKTSKLYIYINTTCKTSVGENFKYLTKEILALEEAQHTEECSSCLDLPLVTDLKSIILQRKSP